MSEVIGYKQIKKCRKNHRCFWCGELITKGFPYVRWCWVDGDIETIKVHPECRDAWHQASDEEGGPYETGPYEHERPEPRMHEITREEARIACMPFPETP